MRQILLLLCFLPLVLHGQAKITPILPLPDHVEYQEGTFLFPKELRVYAEQATATFPVSYTHLRAHETRHDLVCRLLLEKKKQRPRDRQKSLRPTPNAQKTQCEHN